MSHRNFKKSGTYNSTKNNLVLGILEDAGARWTKQQVYSQVFIFKHKVGLHLACI